MTIAAGAGAVRVTLRDTMLVQALEPWPADPPLAVLRNLPPHSRHLDSSFAARLPIGLCGIAQAAPRVHVAPYSTDAWLWL